MITRTKTLLAAAAVLATLAGGAATLYAGGDTDTDTADTARSARSADAARSTESAAIPVAVSAGSDAAVRPEVVVWKSPTCGCCSGWVTYLEEEGFSVTTHDTDELGGIKRRLGLVDPSLESCHTATIDGYVVEGHVPVSDIERLLAERPDVVGISAPGMPMQSPGMGSREPKGYDVVSFDASGAKALFSRH